MKATSDQKKHVFDLLEIHRQNLRHLEKQVALHGGEMGAPLGLLSQLDETKQEIKRLESELYDSESSIGESELTVVPQSTLLARLEGLLGQDAVNYLRSELSKAQARPMPQVKITGDGNIVGDNNVAIVIKDGALREEILRTALAITSPPQTLPPPIRVFISSTMKDLQQECQAIERALEGLDLRIVRTETIGSQSASPYEVSLMMAQECDIYLGVYGGRYGTIVPGDRRSITEIEYQTARKLGKPILIYRKTGVDVEPAQEEFLKFAGDLTQGHTWREFGPEDVPGNLMAWVKQDVRAEIERHPEWAQRPPAKGRILLASLGLSPGAVTGLYHALARAGRQVTRVVTFSPTNRDVRDAAGICQDEFNRLGVPYANHFLDLEDIESEGDAREFKGSFSNLLRESLNSGAEVLAGITGGRSAMGALMAIVVQTSAPDRVTLYHLDVDADIEEDGRLPRLWNFQHDDERWRELLAPPKEKCRLVKVPCVRFPSLVKENNQ